MLILVRTFLVFLVKMLLVWLLKGFDNTVFLQIEHMSVDVTGMWMVHYCVCSRYLTIMNFLLVRWLFLLFASEERIIFVIVDQVVLCVLFFLLVIFSGFAIQRFCLAILCVDLGMIERLWLLSILFYVSLIKCNKDTE